MNAGNLENIERCDVKTNKTLGPHAEIPQLEFC